MAPLGPAMLVVRTIGVAGAVIGGYSLVVASFSPAHLVDSVPGINVGRTDTAGLIGVVVSAICFATVRLAHLGSGSRNLERAGQLLRVVAVYAGTGWTYLAVNSITHAGTRLLPATHLAAHPDEQDLASACLALAALSLLGVWLADAKRRR